MFILKMCDKTRKLCINNNCLICYNKSLKSLDYSNNIVDKTINLRMISKFANKKLNFKCYICEHYFEMRIVNISNGQKCPYCAIPSKILCNDNNCKICFEKSFASNKLSNYWDYNKNEKNPRDVFKNSISKYFFNCNKCNHNFDIALCAISGLEQFCPYCVNQKLCDDEKCIICYEKSFISHPFSINWSKNNIILPRNIFKKTPKKYLFMCNSCNHEFMSRIADLNNNTNNCPYCSSKLLCNDEKCINCNNKSFISNEKSKYWSNKNELNPRNIFKNSNTKYIFNCIDCNNEFISSPNQITNGNNWCPICKHKTEKILLKWLEKNFDKCNIKFQYIIKDRERCYKYDFLIKNLQIIIELDGIQHFEQVKNWTSPEYNLFNDIDKINIAIKNNLSIIHILQSDVYHNRNNWEEKLLEYIKIYEEPNIIIIDNKNIYEKHIKNINTEHKLIKI